MSTTHLYQSNIRAGKGRERRRFGHESGMTPLKIAYAGCDDHVIHKLEMAAGLFRGRGMDVKVQPWEGYDEKLVVTNDLDPYGRKVNEIARSLSIPRLAVFQAVPDTNPDEFWIARDKPAFDYFRALAGAMAGIIWSTRPTAEHEVVRIETLDRIDGELLVHGRARMLVAARDGVCRAASQWDMVTLAEALRRGEPVECLRGDDRIVNRDVVVSLESFVFTTLVGRQSCEWHGASVLLLRGWPDIRNHRYGCELARLSAALLGRARDFEDLTDLAPARVVAAFLYACRVAGLLHENGEVAPESAPKRSGHGGRKGAAVAFRHWLGLSGKGSGGRNKLLFLGPTGAGKTTAIRAISGGPPVVTEEALPGASLGKKSTTTMAMEYHYLKLEDQILHLYGLCGRNGLGAVENIPVSGALGFVLLLDATNDGIYDDARAWLGGVRHHHPDLPVAVGVTKTDHSPHFSLKRLRGVVGPVPALSVDARDGDSLRQLLRLLMMQGA